jgi:hypothetical protein
MRCRAFGFSFRFSRKDFDPVLFQIPSAIVTYDDHLKTPRIGVDQVQAAIDVLKAGAANPGTTGNIVFQPGGVATGNVYTDAAAVAAAITAAHGAVNVIVDVSLLAGANGIIPNGVTWDFQCRGGVIGATNGTNYGYLEIADGGQIRNPGFAFTNLFLLCDSVTKPSIDFSDWTSIPPLTFLQTVITTNTGCTLAPIEIPAGMSLQLFFINSGFTGNQAPTVPCFSIGAGSTLFFSSFGPDTLENTSANLFGGGAGTSLFYNTDGGGFPVPAWTLFTGTAVYASTTGASTVLVNGTRLAREGSLNLVAGYGMGLTGADVPSTQTSQVTIAAVAAHGATAARPASPAVGQTFFDSTLGLPIWWNGTHWINAAGVIS